MSPAEHPAKILILGEARVVHAQRWARYFRERGWIVRWLSFAPVPPGVEAEAIGGTYLSRAAAIVLAVRRVRRIVREFAPDIVSSLFVPDYGWLGALVGARPLVVSAWGSDVLIQPEKSPLHRRRVRHVLSRADHLFTDADVLARRMRQLGAPSAKITVAPLGVEDSWLAVGENRQEEPRPTVTVIQNRRLEPLYRVETLLEAAAQIEKSASGQYRFVVIGEGSQRARLGRLADRLHLGTCLQFVPWLPSSDLRQRLADADLYISTAASDGTSVSLLEAMAAGCFPIATDLPANCEWIEPGGNGLLFPVGDAGALAQQIERAAGDAVLRENARARNRQIITSRARWHDNMEQVEAVMANVIEECRRG